MKKLKFKYTHKKPQKKPQVIRIITRDHSIYPEVVAQKRKQLEELREKMKTQGDRLKESEAESAKDA